MLHVIDTCISHFLGLRCPAFVSMYFDTIVLVLVRSSVGDCILRGFASLVIFGGPYVVCLSL